MAISYRKARSKNAAFRRLIMISALGLIVTFILLLRAKAVIDLITRYSSKTNDYESLRLMMHDTHILDSNYLKLPIQNELSIRLQKRNRMAPMNVDLYPKLAEDHVVIVLYVHNRPQYLRIVVDSLSQVFRISETLLIVSHDGYFEEMNKIVEGIKFCQVKQIFAPYSPHNYPDRFPGVSPFDCKDKGDYLKSKCIGTPDQYGNHRSPKIVSLKHHWWWMMNTVWDGLEETSNYSGHILFIEEDHYIYPNAYSNLQLLLQLKPKKCPYCYAANLAPSNVLSKGEGWERLVAERIGNVGYAFNRTVWRKIHKKAREFCLFDDYNWDITMWAAVYPTFGEPVYTLRGPRTSAVRFGKCGLHQGQGEKTACVNDGVLDVEVEEIDWFPNVRSDWGVFVHEIREGYQAGFKGWGGWGDVRDCKLCLDFAYMYWASS